MRALPYILPFAVALLITGEVRAEGLMVPLDHSTRVSLHGAAANVVVGNPAIADVSVVDSHTLYVSGHAYGSTDIAVIDPLGRTIYAGDVEVVRPAANVTLYRGAERADFSCGVTCAQTDRAQSTGAPKQDSSPGAAVSGTSAPPPHP